MVAVSLALAHLHVLHHFVVGRSAFHQSLVFIGAQLGNFCKNATTSQSISSSCVTPQAGMPVILRPCFTTQNSPPD